MNNIKSTLVVACILLVSVYITGCGSNSTGSKASEEGASAEDSIVIEVGHVAPADESYDLDLNEFSEELSDETDDQVELDVFSGGQLGGELDMAEQVSDGTLDMALVSTGVVSNFEQELQALEVPFLFENVDQAYETLDDEIGQEMLEKLENSNMIGLSFWENGFRQVSNNQHAVTSPEDMEGLTIRTIENELFVDSFEALGANPTPISYPETYSSIQQGVVDGLEASYQVFNAGNMYEVQDYLTEANVYYQSAALIVNDDFFYSLPEDIQKTLKESAEEFKDVQRENNQEREKEYKQKAIDEGVEVTEFDDIDFEAFQQAVQPVIDEYEDKYGDYLDRIRSGISSK